MDVISLNGAWTGRELGEGPTLKKPFAAKVPGCVHLDLRRHKLIPDPYYRDNERAIAWIGEAAWGYSRRFTVSAKTLGRDRLLLRAKGLDTFATVTVNGTEIGRTDNQFRTWEWDVKALLKPGKDANLIEVRFDSATRHANARDAERHIFPGSEYPYQPNGRGYVRKSPCNFGWDWGPVMVTAGIVRDIELVAFDTARLADVRVEQIHRPDHKGPVTLRVEATVERADGADTRPLWIEVAVFDPYTDADESTMLSFLKPAPVPMDASGRVTVEAEIARPQRWWPAGMGAQPLYTVLVNLFDTPPERADEEDELDDWIASVGLRTLRLVREPDAWGESFRFEANGVPFFAKGANWIPADTFTAGIQDGHIDDLLGSAVDAHMNMLRVWGGGIYESDYFYDRCDELGLCVWQDFMFACGAYPSFDPAWMANVKAECEDNVRRIRHHACLALYCGNNEIEQYCMEHPDDPPGFGKYGREDYVRLFDDLIPEVLGRLDPARDYIPSSEFTPGEGRWTRPWDQSAGDNHVWAVWHQRKPFEYYRTCMSRFCSEFGFQSFLEPAGVAEYTAPGDRNVTSRIMELHQRSGIGNATIMDYMLSWYRMPSGFENTLWLSQLQQGMSMKYAIEHWRRNMPRCMGALYWQLNDCWPVASWSSLDWRGRWKALHFAAKKFFAPMLVTGVEDAERHTVDVFVTSDAVKPIPARVAWTLTDTAGKVLARGDKAMKSPSNGSVKALTVDASKWASSLGTENLLLWLSLESGGAEVSANLVHFTRPKHLELMPPRLATTVKAARDEDGAFDVTVKASRPALWAWLSLEGVEARWSDNFVNVRPGAAVTIRCRPASPMTAADVKKALRARSLYDTSVEQQ